MSHSRSPKLLKGAIVQFKTMPIVPIPNIIIFQYNPESLSRTLTPYVPPQPSSDKTKPPSADETSTLSQPQEPTETFSVSLFLDASDALEVPEAHPVAFLTGVADRLAALEMLLYPQGESLLGSLVGSVSVSLGAGGFSAKMSKDAFAKRDEVPVTLFVWGPGRIVPVRLQSFTVEEQQWNQLLYPTRAKVQLGMKVLTKDALQKDTTSSSDGKDIAAFCYDWTRGQKEALAVANIANSVESILGMLPF
ncbi:MAG: hypothetical protein HOV81_00965 [Kofleriaceae bacterium]|nr:hypothetical protein [Kofleriaceae bacterium]